MWKGISNWLYIRVFFTAIFIADHVRKMRFIYRESILFALMTHHIQNISIAKFKTGKLHCWHAGVFNMQVQLKNINLITVTWQWAWWRLKSPASWLFTQLFIQAQIEENFKAPCHWPLCVEFISDGEFPAQRASKAENVSIWWRHHVRYTGSSQCGLYTTVPVYHHCESFLIRLQCIRVVSVWFLIKRFIAIQLHNVFLDESKDE